MKEAVGNSRKILVLVDRALPCGKLARDCFWDKTLASFERRSIADTIENRESVRINEFDIVIVNWDAANGDIITGANDTLLYFKTRSEDRKHLLLYNGGTLACEVQSGNKGFLHQTAYDALFGKSEVQVYSPDLAENEATRHGPKVEVVQKYKNHPIIKGMPGSIATKYVDDGAVLFNFTSDYQHMYSYKYRASMLWSGWFRWWKKGWVPLLVAKFSVPNPQNRLMS